MDGLPEEELEVKPPPEEDDEDEDEEEVLFIFEKINTDRKATFGE